MEQVLAPDQKKANVELLNQGPIRLLWILWALGAKIDSRGCEIGPFGDLWRPWGSKLEVTVCPVAILGEGQIIFFVFFIFLLFTACGPLKNSCPSPKSFYFRGEGPLAPKWGLADSGALANWFPPPTHTHSKIPSAATGHGGCFAEQYRGVTRKRRLRHQK